MNKNNDNKLEYSDSAISIKNAFYSKRAMIYVEGDDDIPFWNELFRSQISEDDYEIEQVGGKENLPRYLNGIQNGNISNAIVACDSDYSMYNDSLHYSSPLIIFTNGHSIENSMFCPPQINDYIRRLSRSTENHIESVNQWAHNFCNAAMKLLPYDILSERNSNGVKCYNLGVANFYFNKTSKVIDLGKVCKHIDYIKKSFDDEDVNNIVGKIEDDGRDDRMKIHGHFWGSAVMDFIREYISKNYRSINLSNVAIYGEFVRCNTCCKSECKDKKYLKDKVSVAVSAL